MLKWRRLTWVFLKTTLGNIYNVQVGGKPNKWLIPFLAVVIAISIASIMFFVHFMLSDIFELFAAGGRLEVATGLILNMSAIIIFVFSMMAAPALYYFAKDVEYLLPLPIKPETIVGAKFTMALLFEYLIALVFIVPMFAALLPHVSAGGLTVHTFITFLTLPVLPVVYSSILCMVLVLVSRSFRNPDKYSLFIGIIATVLGIGLAVVMNRMVMFDADAFIDMVMGAPAVFDTMNIIFINNSAAARALSGVGTGVVEQFINVGVTLLGLAAFIALGRVLYFRGVVGMSESGAPAKKMTKDDIMRQTQSQSRYRSYLAKELRLLFRSPTAFINCVLSALITPVLMLGFGIYGAVSAAEGFALTELLELIDFSNPRIAAAALAIMCASGIFISGMTTITATAISREGKNIFFLKCLPMSYREQLNAKAASGLAVIIPALLLFVIPLAVILRVPPPLFLGGLALAGASAVFLNYLGLLIDIAKPKLDWDNEQAAIKQNMNVLFMVLGGMALTGGVAVVGILLLRTPLPAFLVLFVITNALAFLAYRLTVTKGVEWMKAL